jgi:hypothetical protein
MLATSIVRRESGARRLDPAEPPVKKLPVMTYYRFYEKVIKVKADVTAILRSSFSGYLHPFA